ncbi:response regulator transcription factor [Streptomyces sp. NPDC005708]|uniref:response regulator n=1 Tax=Streptomyces sp. NPDC005708 TaxID=3154564 RepID=UPI0033D3615A
MDDHAEFRALAGELVAAAGLEVAALCPDGQSALEAVAALRPQVVLLDIQLPDISGFDLIPQIMSLSEGVCIVLVSTRDATDYGRRVAMSGATGFIPKEELSVAALAAVIGGP